VAQLGELGYPTDAVVDAEAFFEMEKAEPVVVDQVTEADFIVVNKLDQVDAKRLEKLRKTLARMNARAHRIETSFGAVSSDLLFATGVRALWERSRSSMMKSHTHFDECDQSNNFMFPICQKIVKENHIGIR
jgi:G3E family GTPase